MTYAGGALTHAPAPPWAMGNLDPDTPQPSGPRRPSARPGQRSPRHQGSPLATPHGRRALQKALQVLLTLPMKIRVWDGHAKAIDIILAAELHLLIRGY